MGYETYMTGNLKVTPPMTANDFEAFQKLAAYDDPKDADSTVLALRDQMSGVNAEIELLLGGDAADTATPEELTISGNDYNSHLEPGLDFVIENFFAPRGYVVNGEMDWDGEENGDSGTVYVKDNKVEWVRNSVTNAGPSWAREHFADSALVQAIREYESNTFSASGWKVTEQDAIEIAKQLVVGLIDNSPAILDGEVLAEMMEEIRDKQTEASSTSIRLATS